MAKRAGISGFLEWLPEQKILEDKLISTIKTVYSSHGFTPIETPAVELMSTLATKADIAKEIYSVKRAKAEEQEEAELGLHYDLTVPFARYVGDHFNDLVFPFKRYQLQKVWRGERAQKGRSREFYQFDIDMVAIDELPLSCDAEVVTILSKAFRAINIGRHQVRFNNRKVLSGFYESCGIDFQGQFEALRIVDKINKIGPEGVARELAATLGVSASISDKILSLAQIRVPVEKALSSLGSLGVNSPMFIEGCKEVETVLSLVGSQELPYIELDCSIARGFEYYTGSILEIMLPEYKDFPSVGAGGRYENLASQFIKKKLPGVGASIGLTRLMELIVDNNLIPCNEKCPTKVLVSVFNEDQRTKCNEIAEQIRALGISTEVYFKSPKLGKQIEYADKRGISLVVFVNFENGTLEVKNIKTGEQKPIVKVDELLKLV